MLFLYYHYFILGGAPSPGNATNHNHATAVTSAGGVTSTVGSNFKRQNTVDAATIKENSARVSSTRPSASKNSPGQLDTSEFYHFSIINKPHIREIRINKNKIYLLFLIFLIIDHKNSEGNEMLIICFDIR